MPDPVLYPRAIEFFAFLVDIFTVYGVLVAIGEAIIVYTSWK